MLHNCYTYADLNDTGLIGIDGGAPAGQDAQIGRDPAMAAGILPKIGSGSKGFDFTKIANDGSILKDNAALGSEFNDWACTQDNVTGLTWEIKTSDGGLRDKFWTYTWFSSNDTSNGGNNGSANGGACFETSICDTEKYAETVNVTRLCGFTDWRLPDIEELRSIVDFGTSGPSIETDFFPNTIKDYFWSASVSAFDPLRVRSVFFLGGFEESVPKEFSARVRLVRGGK